MAQAAAPHPFAPSFKHLDQKVLLSYKNVTSSDSNEHDGAACNGKMIAVNWGQTSTVAVFGTDQTRNFDARTPLIKGHNG